ncbi:MAG TPA: quinolinate synthase NadA, partial [Spirochaetia bacterium]|nr:quinolinate synthase NadA [Spirochaetia bacterium]
INSSARVKAAVARAGGMTCTSSNAELLVRAILAEDGAVFFLPDKNLGLNTARALGLPEHEIAVIGPKGPTSALAPDHRLIVWDGFCNVHVRFSHADVLRARSAYPYSRILVHPECAPKVAAAADYAGSTRGIINEVEKARAGEVLFIGTELNLVRRLSKARQDLKILPLRESGCVNMNKITPEKLAAALRTIDDPESPYRVTVEPDIARLSGVSLERMIERVERERSAV